MEFPLLPLLKSARVIHGEIPVSLDSSSLWEEGIALEFLPRAEIPAETTKESQRIPSFPNYY